MPLKYFTFLTFFVFTLLGVFRPLPWGSVAVLFVFAGIPLLDFLMGQDKSNPSPSAEGQLKLNSSWGPALYFYSLTHFLILGLGIMHAREFSTNEVLMLSLVTGLYTGGLGITVAHELCHKKEFLPKTLADLLLGSVWYSHFAVEHVRGHHLQVATPLDPASGRKNETVYAFVVRSVWGSFRHAWEIDKKAVLRGLAISVVLTILCAYLGRNVLIFFLLQSVIAFVLLEFVNYIEHYGLSRKQLENGRYEKVLPIHSWNSSHIFSNLLLFNLQRHSDHHALAHLPYTVLKHHEEAPQLPSGYPAMILLALFPPLWFRFMNPRIEELERKCQK